MSVVSLARGNAVRMAEPGVEVRNLAHSLMRAFYWEKIKHRSRHEHRPRIHQQQQSGMVHALRNHPVKVLLRIAIRVFEDPVVDSHGKGSDVAGWGCNLNTRIKCGDVRSLKSAAAGAGDVDALRINFGAGQ